MSNIFVINGQPRSGKTTFGRIVNNILEENGISFLHISSVALVKMLLMPTEFWANTIPDDLTSSFLDIKKSVTETDWNGCIKNEEWRNKMYELKLAINKCYPGYINEWILAQYHHDVMFVDIREPENILSFQSYAASHGLLVRTILVSSDLCTNFNNPADNVQSNGIIYDYQIYNNAVNSGYSYAALESAANEFVNSIIYVEAI